MYCNAQIVRCIYSSRSRIECKCGDTEAEFQDVPPSTLTIVSRLNEQHSVAGCLIHYRKGLVILLTAVESILDKMPIQILGFAGQRRWESDMSMPSSTSNDNQSGSNALLVQSQEWYSHEPISALNFPTSFATLVHTSTCEAFNFNIHYIPKSRLCFVKHACRSMAARKQMVFCTSRTCLRMTSFGRGVNWLDRWRSIQPMHRHVHIRDYFNFRYQPSPT